MVPNPWSAMALCAGLVASAAAVAQQGDDRDLIFDFRPRIQSQARVESGQPDKPGPVQDLRAEIYLQPRIPSGCGAENREYLGGPRVGVVLSGGISKGVAFIGALALLDELDIRVDGIVGTSMGAVVGSFYASGYSPNAIYVPGIDLQTATNPEKTTKLQAFGRTLESPYSRAGRSIVGAIDWDTLFTDLPPMSILTFNQQNIWGLGEGNNFLPRIYQGGLRSGQNVYTLLSKYLMGPSAASSGCFDDLYVPFRAVASDITNGRVENFRQGYLANAVRASLSFPILFTPVFIEGTRYRDGGLLRNYPVESINAIQNRKFSLVLGFDVSDTSVPVLSEAPFLPILSLKDVIGGALDDGLGAAISLETRKQRQDANRCEKVEEIPEPGTKKSCLLDTRISFKGGFTDFHETAIDDFYWKGYVAAQRGFCKFFSVPDQDCSTDKLKIQIKKKKAERLLYPAQIISPDTVEEIDATAGKALKIEAGDEGMRSAEIAERLRMLLDKLPGGGWKPRRDYSDPSGTLQGMVIRRTRNETVVYADEAVKGDRELLAEVRAVLRWQAGALAKEPASGATHLEKLSSIKVIVTRREIIVKATSWEYMFGNFGVYTDFTERDSLKSATRTQWSHDDPKPADSGVLPDKSNPERQCPKTDPKGLQPIQWSNKHCARPGEAFTASEWTQVIRAKLRKETRPFDVRYNSSTNSLPAILEESAGSYYAQGNTEYVRVEDIRRDELLLSEKSNNGNPAGTVYFDYQYDYVDKHTYIAKHSKYYQATSLHQLTNVAVNDPTSDPSGMRYIDTTLTYFNGSSPFIPRDVSLNVYNAHRVQRMMGEEDPLRLSYEARGIKLIAGQSTHFQPSESKALSSSSFFEVDYRSIDTINANDFQAVGSRLRDPTLQSGGLREMLSYHFGVRLYQIGFLEPGILRLSLHTPSGNSSFKEFYLEENVKYGRAETSIRAGVLGQRLARGGVTYNAQPPFDQMYGVGGYYPMLEDRFWGAKRFDYIGAEMNQRWGTRAFLYSLKYPIVDISDFRIFHPKAKARVDLVYDFAYVGFPDDNSRKSRSAFGVSASAFIPVLSTLQPKANLAIGGETLNTIKISTSVDIVF